MQIQLATKIYLAHILKGIEKTIDKLQNFFTIRKVFISYLI